MPNPITPHEEMQFAAFYLNSNGDKKAAFMALKPKVRSELAAERGGQRMFARPGVQKAIEEIKKSQAKAIDTVNGAITIFDDETLKLTRTISLTEIQLITEYIDTAMLDHLSYYREGKPIPLEELTPELRRQIRKIEWEDAGQGKRRPRDYVLEDRSEARGQLAKIMGIINPAFDFAGLVALLTGQKKQDVEEQVRRLDHVAGTNFQAIKKRAGLTIDGEVTQ